MSYGTNGHGEIEAQSEINMVEDLEQTEGGKQIV